MTPNDPGDVDASPNHFQNFPVLTSALVNGGSLTVQGTLNSAANTTYRVELFGQGECDPTGHGEGETLLAAFDVTTDGSGNASFSRAVVPAPVITATATDPAGNTSEFSACATSRDALIDLSIDKADSADPVQVNTPFTYTLTVQNAGPDTATNVEVIDTLPAGVIASQAQSTRGTCALVVGNPGNQVSCDIGALAPGENAVITITVSAATPGLKTNTAAVSGAEPESDTGNNLAIEETMVEATAQCTAATFSGPASLFVPGSQPQATDLLMGDLNGDGFVDLVAPLANANSIAVYLGNGTGGFGTPTVIASGNGPLEGELVDLNGDQRLDLALEGLFEGQVRFGDGAGGFGAPTTFLFANEAIADVRTGDFNGDGHRDLVISAFSGTSSTLRIFLNNGQGVFTEGSARILDRRADRLVVRDFNGDGRADVAASFANFGNALLDDTLYLLLGDGQGAVGNPTAIPLSSQANRSFVHDLGDLNGDGFGDLGVVQFDGALRRLVLLFGDGAGAFQQSVLANAPSRMFRVISADVNGDTRLDLVSSDNNRIGVQFGNGAGVFADPVYVAAMSPGDLRVADFNGDGRPDIAAAIFRAGAGGVSVFLNVCGQPQTDLQVAVTDNPDPASEGTVVTETITVTNAGPIPATNVNLMALPGGVTGHVQSFTTTAGVCTETASQLSCSLGTIPSGGTVTVTLGLVPHTGGVATLTAGVTSDQGDSNPGDNLEVEQTVVNATGGTLVVTNTNDSGSGSLRQAILDSNADAGDVDRIEFNISGPGPHVITLQTNWATLLQPVVIDATTQPGYTDRPVVQLVGNATQFNGFGVAAGNTTIRGLSITGFPGNGIHIAGPGGNVIEANHLGTDVTGTLARGNGNSGVAINGSSNNRIGGPLPTQRNVVSGNGTHGVSITGAASTGNVVQGNYIGTTAAGTAALANLFQGVEIVNAPNNVIGGTVAGAGNVVSGQAQNAIVVSGVTATGNVIQGNLIGTAADGASPLPNQGSGILISNASSNTIGSPLAGGGIGNVIAFNAGHGVAVQGASHEQRHLQQFDPFEYRPGHRPRRRWRHRQRHRRPRRGRQRLAELPGPVERGAHGDSSSTSRPRSTPLRARLHTIEFFRNASCDPSGFGEAQTSRGGHHVGGRSTIRSGTPRVVPSARSPSASSSRPRRSSATGRRSVGCLSIVAAPCRSRSLDHEDRFRRPGGREHAVHLHADRTECRSQRRHERDGHRHSAAGRHGIVGDQHARDVHDRR